FGGLLGGLAVMIWWLFFSRAAWVERLGALALMIAGIALTPQILHPSIATGMMGLMFTVYAVPVLSLTLVLWAVLTRHLPDGRRRLALVASLVLACVGWALVRSDGISGAAGTDFEWRWSSTAEEELLAQAGGASAEGTAALSSAVPVEWPGFRGPQRNSSVPGTQIATDWSASPPEELWRRPIGPGWSSFAVRGDFFYTHEQRGEEEVVSCYRASTGEPVWQHADPVRFWEANAGAGPRSTPALSGGRVYSFGATGVLNALDAEDGTVLWARNVTEDTGAEVPGWGFASSPLVMQSEGVGETVLVHAGALAAYDAATGELRWVGPESGGSYSSPHHATVGGLEQVLQLSWNGVRSFAPSDGTVLWEYEWPSATRIVQPGWTEDGDLLISAGESKGLRRVALTQSSGEWKVEERWTTHRLKPYFSDFVVHQGHAYGFDGSILACIDLETGERRWKGGRYGSGQMLLLPDQHLLLVISEKGELALVSATPDAYAELARAPAIEGKTWNHPVLAGDLLLVRNGEEMAGFRLSGIGSRPPRRDEHLGGFS
ncbi:MAG: PQQ-binding-like beta-propeller repeat protein, partial [Acidobacteriota bacterium]|nr:PQQ-binding-like beta-propeller repeat protein [Acidobacteriota bacterium]